MPARSGIPGPCRDVLETSLQQLDEQHFRAGAEECAAMMRSVRFEGPS
jgi:hypothetical protein